MNTGSIESKGLLEMGLLRGRVRRTRLRELGESRSFAVDFAEKYFGL